MTYSAALTSYKKLLKAYVRETAATILVAFAVMAPVVVSAAGMALDFAHAHLVRERLSHALDAAALAATAAGVEGEELEQMLHNFFEANYPPEKLGVAYNLDFEVVGDDITVHAYADYHTTFLSVIGFETITVFAQTTIHREVRGIEVVLVLDNTGSMATNNNIDALKDATESFITTLFDATDDPENIKIGMVPYSNSVRIGRYGLGLNPDGTQYADGDVFVTLPAGVSYTTSKTSSSGWYGCIVEHMDNEYYNASATHVANTKGQLWHTGASCTNNSNCRGHGWQPGISNNDPYPQDIEDDFEGPWDIYMYGQIINNGAKCSDLSTSQYNFSNSTPSRCNSCSGSGGACTTGYCYCLVGTSGSQDSGPNTGCPHAYVLPLTSDEEELLDRIDDMEPEGNTAGNVGMAWGYRMISPESPFEEGSEWGDEHWRKVVVMMTDGDNTIDSGSIGYSYYGSGSRNNMTVTKMNNRFAEVCEALKDQDVLVYTITFYSNINEATKAYYRNCATDESYYHDAPTQEELQDVFERISNELAQLHIAG